MGTLLRYFSWRYVRRHPVRVLLSLLSVALGVAIYVSVDVSNTSAEAAFRKTVDRLAGEAHLQVMRGRMLGVEEEALAKIEAVPGVRAAPILQLGSTIPPGGESVLVLGIDFRRDAAFRKWGGGDKVQASPFAFLARDPVVVPRSFAARRNLRPGSTVAINTPDGPQPLVVAAIVPDEGAAQVFGGNILVLHARSAQRLFRRPGRFDRVEVRVDGDVQAAAAKLRESLGPEYLVQPPPRHNSFLEEALTRIKALLGVSVIALLVGVFIIYNSVAISVVERVKEIGTLRSIGATRGQVFRSILLEWSIVGLLGSGLGLVIGVTLAKVLTRMTAGEVNQLTMVVDLGEITLLPRTVLLGAAVGVLTAFVAAFFPGRKAMAISPVEMLREGVLEVRESSGYLKWLALGLVAIVIGMLPSLDIVRFENAGLFAAFVSFFGAALVLPQLTLWASRAARPLLGKWFHIGGVLAADNLGNAPRRTALTVIALSGALAMMVASAAIILSIRIRSDAWLEDALPFDCMVSGTDYNETLYTGAQLPDETPAIVRGAEGVDYVYRVREALQDYGERDIMIVAVETAGYLRAQIARGRRGLVRAEVEEDWKAGGGVIVSDNFAALHGNRVGDRIELRTRTGTHGFRILGTYEDYSWPLGVVFVDLGVYERRWGDSGISYVEAKFKAGAAHADVRRRIADRLRENSSLFVYDVDDLRRVGEETLDRTLRFTNVQVAVSAVIGFLGIVNTLLISVMGRTREIGLLRAVGMTRSQLAGMILIESLLMSVVGGVLGVGLGVAAARWPLALHVFQISGYLVPLAVPWASIALALGAAVAIGVLASILPARRAAALNVLEAITYE